MSDLRPANDEWKPTILLVEDDKVLAQLNARLLKRQGYHIVIAYTAAEARQQFAIKTPDLMVLDVSLPDGDGVTLCREFRRETDVPVLFLTGKSETKDKVAGLDSGGDYYLTKPFDSNEFLAVIHSLLRREQRIRELVSGSSVISKGSLMLNLDERRAYIDGNDTGLSPKEFTLLLLLVQNEDKEMTNEILYETVWNAPMINNTGAVRVHISNLKRKLGKENAKDFSIYNEPGKGYIFTTL